MVIAVKSVQIKSMRNYYDVIEIDVYVILNHCRGFMFEIIFNISTDLN